MAAGQSKTTEIRGRWVETQTDGGETERQVNGETDWGKTRDAEPERWV